MPRVPPITTFLDISTCLAILMCCQILLGIIALRARFEPWTRHKGLAMGKQIRDIIWFSLQACCVFETPVLELSIVTDHKAMNFESVQKVLSEVFLSTSWKIVLHVHRNIPRLVDTRNTFCALGKKYAFLAPKYACNGYYNFWCDTYLHH